MKSHIIENSCANGSAKRSTASVDMPFAADIMALTSVAVLRWSAPATLAIAPCVEPTRFMARLRE